MKVVYCIELIDGDFQPASIAKADKQLKLKKVLLDELADLVSNWKNRFSDPKFTNLSTLKNQFAKLRHLLLNIVNEFLIDGTIAKLQIKEI